MPESFKTASEEVLCAMMAATETTGAPAAESAVIASVELIPRSTVPAFTSTSVETESE